ncbi:acetate kinase, partial [Lacticaseibacillus rhamnosus]
TRAKLALDIFVNRVVKYVGSYAALMDGVDVLVFTAGIGENGDEIRDKIMRSLDYLGAKIDNDLNYKSHGVEADLSTADSTVKTLLVPTNEELMIVRDVMALS